MKKFNNKLNKKLSDIESSLKSVTEKSETSSKEDLSQLVKLIESIPTCITNTISPEISKLSNLPADVSKTLKGLTNSVSELSQDLEQVKDAVTISTNSTKYDHLTCPSLNNYFNSYHSLKDKIFVEPTEESLSKYQQKVTDLILQQSIASTPSSKQFLLIPHPEKFQGEDLYWLFIEPQLRLERTNILTIRYFFRDKNQPQKYITEAELEKTCKLSKPALVVEIPGTPRQWKLIRTGRMEMVS